MLVITMDNKTGHLLKMRHLQMFLQHSLPRVLLSAQPDIWFVPGMSPRIFCVCNLVSWLLGT
jgi:hypothetical protein